LAPFVRFAAVVWLAVFASAAAASAAPRSDSVSTRCRELEVPLDANHSSARLNGCGDDTADDLLWHLDRLDQVEGRLDGTFERSNRGAGAVVYVMDTGIMATHDEFAGAGGSRVIAGYDVTQSVPFGASNCRSANKAVAPCYSDYTELLAASHGTGVASLVAGRNVGVAPDASVVSIRVMNERGLATTRTYLDGLNAIVRHAWSRSTPPFRTAVVNISGWVLERLSPADTMPYVPFSTIEQKMRDMIGGVDANGRRDVDGKRFLFVVAGNNLDGGCGHSGVIDRFPALLGPSMEGLITVGGMTMQNHSWTGACRGGLEVLAPAQGIFSATITAADHYRGRKPNLRSGTSFSAPLIAGIAARLIAAEPEITPVQLEALITSTPSRIANPSTDYADGKVATTEVRHPQLASMFVSGVTVPFRMLESDR
jgi:subtilisin family serine protease